jgi:diaminopimelate decarboxylase
LKGNKFGVPHDQALATYVQAAAMPGIEVLGIDCHIGSQITQIEPFVDALDRLLDLVDAVEAKGIRLHHIDVGGGLGIVYTDEQPPRPLNSSRLLQRLDSAAAATRKCCWSPAVRWWAMPAFC